MKDPERLIQDGTSFEKALIRSGKSEAAPHGKKQRAVALLGITTAATASAATVGAGTAATATASVAATTSLEVGVAAGTTATSAAATSVVTSGITLATVKWIGVGVVAGFCGVGAATQTGLFAGHSSRPPLTAPQPIAAIPKPFAAASVPTAEYSSPRTSASSEPAEPNTTTPMASTESAAGQAPMRKPFKRASEPAASSESAESQATNHLTAELAVLDRARQEIARGVPRRALAVLDDYARSHPGGSLREEAFVLRIEANLAEGNSQKAKSLGKAFLDQHPASPYGARVRSLIGIESSDP